MYNPISHYSKKLNFSRGDNITYYENFSSTKKKSDKIVISDISYKMKIYLLKWSVIPLFVSETE